jgi:hypothetical protein
MFALLAILGTGLAAVAGEAIAISRQPVRRAQCADCHTVQESWKAARAVDRQPITDDTARLIQTLRRRASSTHQR